MRVCPNCGKAFEGKQSYCRRCLTIKRRERRRESAARDRAEFKHRHGAASHEFDKPAVGAGLSIAGIRFRLLAYSRLRAADVDAISPVLEILKNTLAQFKLRPIAFEFEDFSDAPDATCCICGTQTQTGDAMRHPVSLNLCHLKCYAKKHGLDWHD